MKAYALDLRERVVKFVHEGGSKAEATRRFDLGRQTVYRYLAAAKKGGLAPKTSWGTWRKLDPQKLQIHVKKTSRRHPQGTPKDLRRQPSRDLGASGTTGLHAKKTHKMRPLGLAAI
jgi:transposase